MARHEIEDLSDGDATEKEHRYRAPALEKGLDILEMISVAGEPMTAAMITQKLGRSTGELFRMIQVLEYRGFIEQAENGGGYVTSSKLFQLGMAQPPMKNLLEVALPVMRRLADETEQSCHLATRAGGDIAVVARMEAAGLIGFAVRIGYRRPIPLTGSGAALFAFQPEAVRNRWERDFDPAISATQLAEFHERARQISRDGYSVRPSDSVKGIIDLSAPVMRGDAAAAALTVPFVEKNPLRVGMDQTIALLCAAAGDISSNLMASDYRV